MKMVQIIKNVVAHDYPSKIIGKKDDMSFGQKSGETFVVLYDVNNLQHMIPFSNVNEIIIYDIETEEERPDVDTENIKVEKVEPEIQELDI
jgi:hypothetical protein